MLVDGEGSGEDMAKGSGEEAWAPGVGAAASRVVDRRKERERARAQGVNEREKK